jgi:3-isopropylmalate/(R)-2-methylmalate dehydratase large subunit
LTTRTATGFSTPSRATLKRQYGSHYAGVCHTALPPRATRGPAKCCSAPTRTPAWPGAFNQFATGIGNTDAGFVMGTGKLLIKVPETMHFRLEGKLQPGVMAKDIILHCIGEIGFDGATYRAMQFDGPGAASLSMDDRMTIANMAIEAGGKNGIFEFDAPHGGICGCPREIERHQIHLRTGRADQAGSKSSFTNSSWI